MPLEVRMSGLADALSRAPADDGPDARHSLPDKPDDDAPLPCAAAAVSLLVGRGGAGISDHHMDRQEHHRSPAEESL